MSKINLLLVFSVLLNMSLFSQNKNRIAYSQDSTFKVINHIDQSSAYNPDSIVLYDMNNERELILYIIEDINTNDCVDAIPNVVKDCVVRGLPVIHEVFTIRDSILVLAGISHHIGIYVKHLIFINKNSWQIINRTAFLSTRGNDNISFVILDNELIISRVLNSIYNDTIYVLNNSNGAITHVKISNKLIYYDRGRDVKYNKDGEPWKFHKSLKENELFESDIFVIDLFNADLK